MRHPERPGPLSRVRAATPLWLQFGFLVLVVVTAGLVLNYLRYSASGKRILLEHETVDLGDDATLRVYELRESFESLTGRVNRAGRALNGEVPPTPDQARAAMAKFRAEFPAAGSDDASPDADAVRLRFFTGTLAGAAVLDAAAGVVATDTLDAANPAVGALLADAVARAGRRENASAVSGVALDGERALVAVTRPARYERVGPGGGEVGPTHFFAAVIDLTRALTNRARLDPRHYLILTTPGGLVLFHPDPGQIGKPVWGDIPNAEAANWPEPGEPDSARVKRRAELLDDGGVQVPPGPVAGLLCAYQKGYFGGAPGGVGADAARRLGPVLDRLRDGTPRRRIGQVGPSSEYVEVAVAGSGPATEAALTDARRAVEAAWGKPVRWADPVECKNFQGQLTELDLARDDVDDPPRLVVVASVEELAQDIKSQFDRIGLESLGFAAVASGLTLVGVAALTLRLAKLARAAARLSDPAHPAVITGGGSREVTQLAQSLTQLVRNLRDSAARFETILRTAGEGIVVADSGGRVEEANRAAAAMFGYASPEEMVGTPVGDLLAEAESPLTETLSGAPGAPPAALRGKRRGGERFWLEATLRSVQLPDRHVLTGVFRDVTSRKAAEDELQKLYTDLERRVRVRTAELAESNTKLEATLRQAEAAGRAKDAFVANMSHELRQPLHIIIGFTEAMKEELADAGDSPLAPDLDKVLAAARHLLDLINDILDLAKIAAGKMELSLTRFSIGRAVAAVRALTEPLAEKNGNALAVDVPDDIGEMTADERRVRQMLLNLLSNAFKFTKAGTVALTVRRVELRGRALVEFAVADTGQGIAPEPLGRLFQRFFQADDATTRAQGGTGLGLAITQSFNEVMAGEPIEVTSELGVGSRFVVRLPETVASVPEIVTRLPEAKPLAFAPPPPAGRISSSDEVVLVIDDDPGVQELMRRFLAREGFRVVSAVNGAEGMRLARELRPVAVTLDVMMPGLDGWHVLSELKADPLTADIPVVMLTIVDDRGRGFALGAADYLTKPVDWARLAAILSRYHSPDAAPALVVDDDPESRRVIRRFLEREGWRVVEAADGEAGLRAVAAETPALVLLDLMMPVLDGFGFLSEMPRRFPNCRVPVVVLTAKDLTADDFDRLNGRVARILEKEDLSQFESVAEQVRAVAEAGRRG